MTTKSISDNQWKKLQDNIHILSCDAGGLHVQMPLKVALKWSKTNDKKDIKNYLGCQIDYIIPLKNTTDDSCLVTIQVANKITDYNQEYHIIDNGKLKSYKHSELFTA
jgi:hypothetical protein